eukprot:294115-Pelagomonas_calceolata.AAC.7
MEWLHLFHTKQGCARNKATILIEPMPCPHANNSHGMTHKMDLPSQAKGAVNEGCHQSFMLQQVRNKAGSQLVLPNSHPWHAHVDQHLAFQEVLKFIHERIAAFALEDPHASQGPEEVGRMMWQALAIMVKHEGLLKHAQLKKPGVCVSRSLVPRAWSLLSLPRTLMSNP